MDRRSFLAIAIGALATPLAAESQQVGKVYRVGVLGIASAQAIPHWQAALEATFRELGYVPGRNLVLEYRFAAGDPVRLRQFASELAELPADVIIAGTDPAIAAAKQATSTIPIVMGTSANPVRAGFIHSFARPGGNATGLTVDPAPETLVAKQVSLLRELLPNISRVAVLWNPSVPFYRDYLNTMESAAKRLGLSLQSLEVQSAAELETLFAMARQQRAEAMFVLANVLTFTHRREIAERAMRQALPSTSYTREYAEAGSLMAYGVNLVDIYRRTAHYVDRILKGAAPAELPVEQPSTFELVINLKTAKALGLTIPPSLLLRADHVIE